MVTPRQLSLEGQVSFVARLLLAVLSSFFDSFRIVELEGNSSDASTLCSYYRPGHGSELR